MKKGRYFLQFLLAGILGGFVGFIFSSDYISYLFSTLNYAKSTYFLVTSCASVTLLLIVMTIYQFMIQKDAL
ncbi:hypothetical protein MTQ94_00550 [Staphylococcus agnetis]|nr:hypothetical protein [Staphylococcus agnetis]MCO4325579.1 hypothetical protein [Staphylococcus agnetis]MCO4338900.1 hypothetical protein [Staphylococcus agnetis]MCO4339965.1 hypothetical protein [Staphylococcus agnetis]MCO4342269.1 hypothetical protein [Staphylococcus agnetis]MCO4344602.1 hypothetical protein [Staphylococcus agnetis]